MCNRESDIEMSRIAGLASQVVEAEAEALRLASERVGEQIAQAVEVLSEPTRRDVIVTGVGKSGHIGRKIASTLTSVGVRAHFIPTSELFHGDLGAIDESTSVILISKSGSGGELAQLVAYANGQDVPVIGILGDTKCALAKELTVLIDASVPGEADVEGIVPTSSTTVALAVGDALAVSLMSMRGFTAMDFAQFHPNGALGARLARVVKDVMIGRDSSPVVRPASTVRDLAVEMTRLPTGLALVEDEDGRLTGVVSDGDLRRALLSIDNLGQAQVLELMTSEPTTITPDAHLAAALAVMEGHRPRPISALPVVEGDSVVGLLTIHQLHQASDS